MDLRAQLETPWKILGICALQIAECSKPGGVSDSKFHHQLKKLPPNLQVQFLNWNTILDLRLNSKNCGLLLNETTALCADDSQIGTVNLSLAADLYQILVNNRFQSKTAESKNFEFKDNTLSSTCRWPLPRSQDCLVLIAHWQALRCSWIGLWNLHPSRFSRPSWMKGSCKPPSVKQQVGPILSSLHYSTTLRLFLWLCCFL